MYSVAIKVRECIERPKLMAIVSLAIAVSRYVAILATITVQLGSGTYEYTRARTRTRRFSDPLKPTARVSHLASHTLRLRLRATARCPCSKLSIVESFSRVVASFGRVRTRTRSPQSAARRSTRSSIYARPASPPVA